MASILLACATVFAHGSRHECRKPEALAAATTLDAADTAGQSQTAPAKRSLPGLARLLGDDWHAWVTLRDAAASNPKAPTVLFATSVGIHAAASTFDCYLAVALTARGARCDVALVRRCAACMHRCRLYVVSGPRRSTPATARRRICARCAWRRPRSCSARKVWASTSSAMEACSPTPIATARDSIAKTTAAREHPRFGDGRHSDWRSRHVRRAAFLRAGELDGIAATCRARSCGVISKLHACRCSPCAIFSARTLRRHRRPSRHLCPAGAGRRSRAGSRRAVRRLESRVSHRLLHLQPRGDLSPGDARRADLGMGEFAAQRATGSEARALSRRSRDGSAGLDRLSSPG